MIHDHAAEEDQADERHHVEGLAGGEQREKRAGTGKRQRAHDQQRQHERFVERGDGEIEEDRREDERDAHLRERVGELARMPGDANALRALLRRARASWRCLRRQPVRGTALIANGDGVRSAMRAPESAESGTTVLPLRTGTIANSCGVVGCRRIAGSARAISVCPMSIVPSAART